MFPQSQGRILDHAWDEYYKKTHNEPYAVHYILC